MVCLRSKIANKFSTAILTKVSLVGGSMEIDHKFNFSAEDFIFTRLFIHRWDS